MIEAHLERVDFTGANLKKANFKGANMKEANLRCANLEGTNLKWANLEGANLRDAHNLSFDQISEVLTLQGAKLNEELFESLKEDYYALFVAPENSMNDKILP